MPPTLSVSPATGPKLESLIHEAVNTSQTPPYFFKAVSAEGTLAECHFGKGSDGKEIEGDTVIRIHSMTKMVTSVSPSSPPPSGLLTGVRPSHLTDIAERL